MATSPDIQITELIKTAVNAETFSQGFTAERVYSADWSVKDELSELQVGVWPGESEAELWERTSLRKSYQVGITFAKILTRASLDEIDALGDLVNEVVESIELITVTASGLSYANKGWEYLVRFDDSRLDRNKNTDGTITYTGLFASAIVFNFEEGG